MLRVVRAECEALEVGGDFLNDGVERFPAADLFGSRGRFAVLDCLFAAVFLVDRRAHAPERRRRGDVDLELLSGPTDDAFARRRLIESADDTDDGGHDLEFSPDLGEVVLDHGVI